MSERFHLEGQLKTINCSEALIILVLPYIFFGLEISAAVSTQIDGNIAISPYILTTLVWKTLHDLYHLFLITTNIKVEPKCQRIICNAY